MSGPLSDVLPYDHLFGTWILVSNEWITSDGEVVQRPFGEEPLGQLIYTADGSVCAVLASRDRSGEHGGFLAYTGSWELRGDSVVHHVLTGSIPEDAGRDRVRTYSLEGDRLMLTAPSRVVDGIEQIHRIVWRRRGS